MSLTAHEIDGIIRNEIYCLAPYELIESLYDNEDFLMMGYDDASGEYADALEFYLISNNLAQKLKAIGEPVMELSTCSLWGRTTSGQAIYLDGTIQKAYNPEEYEDESEDESEE